MATKKAKQSPKKAAPARKTAARTARQAKQPVSAKRAVAVNKNTATSAKASARPNGDALQREVEQFLYRQSELLDSKRWQEYIDCFATKGVYWMPSLPEHTHWDGVPAIFIEDKDLMTVRMRRVEHPNAWSQQAEWATNHVVSNITIERIDARTGELHVRSRFHMMELRRDDLRHFGGTYRHHLKRDKNGLKIMQQRVDLVNAQAPYEYVLQVWV